MVRWRNFGSSLALVALVAIAVAVAVPQRAAPAAPVARAAACNALGAADGFAIFSHQTFTAPAGVSMIGRLAAAGTVTLGSGVNLSGSPSPAIVAGGDFVAGKSGGGGTVNGGVRYAANKDVASNFTINGGLNQASPGDRLRPGVQRSSPAQRSVGGRGADARRTGGSP